MPSLERAASLAFAGRLREADKLLGIPDGYEEQWLRAYLHNCFGRFDEALDLGLRIAEESGDARLASQSLVTAASALRQIQRHLPAHPLDESALRLAPDDLARTHALIGLAADSVGLGRERECAHHIEQAAALMPPADWRARVRLTWVRCEHALLSGRARKAVTHARDALERAHAAGARRHQAKSLLFLGIALREAGDRDWVAALKKAKDMAGRMGAAPIAAVAGAALADAPSSSELPSPGAEAPPPRKTTTGGKTPTARKATAGGQTPTARKATAAGKSTTARKTATPRKGATARKGTTGDRAAPDPRKRGPG